MTCPTDTTDPQQTAVEVSILPVRDGEEAQVRAVAGRAFDRFDRLLFSTRGREVLVAVDGEDQVVGGVVLHATSPGTLGRLGVVHFIFADPDARVPRIGTRLRDAADARFDALGCTETSARIDVTNSASQELHRAVGYRPTTVGQQLRRWGWRLPLRWWQAGTGFDPGMQLWLRPAPEDRSEPDSGRARAVTAVLNLLLLAIVAWRAPRADGDALTVAGTLAATVALFLGAREGAIRLAAVMLALFDLVLGFPPLIGTAAQHSRTWSVAAYGAIAPSGMGPLVITML